MEKAKVYFTDLHTSTRLPLVEKMKAVAKAAGIETIDFKDKFVAIKMHFGEPGNLAFLRPNYAAGMADLVRSLGGKPYLTDANTLYSGGRSNAVDHLESACRNGFNRLSAGCDVIIADGVKGTDCRELPIEGGTYYKTAKIGTAIADSDVLIALSHFKGHEQTGFGGALKNMGMGCASVAGKLELHSSSKPIVKVENCRCCGICVKHCAHDAIHLETVEGTNHAGKHIAAVIDYTKCVGCGQCVALCQYESAVLKDWDTSETLNGKIAEYTKAIVTGRPCFYVNLIVNVSPECDCWNHNDAAIVPDLGIAASFDPVALDQACADMVMAAPALPGSKLEKTRPHEHLCGEDKFHILHPDTNWQFGLEHAERINIGTRRYELITI